RREPADRHPRQAQAGAFAQQARVGVAGAGRGAGGKEGAAGDVAGGGRGRGAGALQAGRAAGAEEGAGPERGPGRGQGAVVFAQVGAVGADPGGQAPVVIDQHGNVGGAAGGQHGRGLFARKVPAGQLVPVLDEGGASGQQRLQAGQQAAGVGLVGGQQVEAAARPTGGVHLKAAAMVRQC